MKQSSKRRLAFSSSPYSSIDSFVNNIFAYGAKAYGFLGAKGDAAAFRSSAIFGTAGIILNILGLLFGSSSPAPNPDLPYLQEINQTTIETLQMVTQLQTEIAQVSTQIAQDSEWIVTTITNAIASSEANANCAIAYGYVESLMQSIQSQYNTFAAIELGCSENGCGQVLDPPPSTILVLAQNVLEAAAGGYGLNNTYIQEQEQQITDWARTVTSISSGSQLLYQEILQMGYTLLNSDGTGGNQGILPGLQQCSKVR